MFAIVLFYRERGREVVVKMFFLIYERSILNTNNKTFLQSQVIDILNYSYRKYC